jgi:hypothetical protein
MHSRTSLAVTAAVFGQFAELGSSGVSLLSMRIRMVAADIGSVRPPSKFAWAAFDSPDPDVIADGTDPEAALSVLAQGLLAGVQSALLLEAPMAVPVPGNGRDEWRSLGKARAGERNRPWSAAAGLVHWRPG